MVVDLHTHPLPRSVYLEKGNYENYNIEDELKQDGTFTEDFIQEFMAEMSIVDRVVVLTVAAPNYVINIPNDYISRFVDACGEKVIGFASVNPNSKSAPVDLESAIQDYGLSGVKLAPIYQNFEPDNRNVYPVYEKIEELGIPIMWHQGTSLAARYGPLEYANPTRLDKILRDFPSIKMVISHMGYPWYAEAVALAKKHPQLYLDISAMSTRRWFLFNAIVAAIEYGVMEKILFGSDYPWYTPDQTRETLLSLSEISNGTGLPSIPEDMLQSIINRDSLKLLGI